MGARFLRLFLSTNAKAAAFVRARREFAEDAPRAAAEEKALATDDAFCVAMYARNAILASRQVGLAVDMD